MACQICIVLHGIIVWTVLPKWANPSSGEFLNYSTFIQEEKQCNFLSSGLSW